MERGGEGDVRDRRVDHVRHRQGAVVEPELEPRGAAAAGERPAQARRRDVVAALVEDLRLLDQLRRAAPTGLQDHEPEAEARIDVRPEPPAPGADPLVLRDGDVVLDAGRAQDDRLRAERCATDRALLVHLPGAAGRVGSHVHVGRADADAQPLLVDHRVQAVRPDGRCRGARAELAGDERGNRPVVVVTGLDEDDDAGAERHGAEGQSEQQGEPCIRRARAGPQFPFARHRHCARVYARSQ